MNNWDKRFMDMAELVSTWTSCARQGRAIGAIIVKDKRILTTGYNGFVHHSHDAAVDDKTRADGAGLMRAIKRCSVNRNSEFRRLNDRILLCVYGVAFFGARAALYAKLIAHAIPFVAAVSMACYPLDVLRRIESFANRLVFTGSRSSGCCMSILCLIIHKNRKIRCFMRQKINFKSLPSLHKWIIIHTSGISQT